ncbi:MAG: DUF1803 domain-containing protein, partial [Streptococcaceae bacterium]|nr:DUF1803 domain-containing protein [Streptococcaceae bacterium]
RIYSPKKYEARTQKLLSNPLFLPIFEEVSAHPKQTLRELKLIFPQKDFMKTLEEMIQLGILSRWEKRYSAKLKLMDDLSDIFPNDVESSFDICTLSNGEDLKSWVQYFQTQNFEMEQILLVKKGSLLDDALQGLVFPTQLKVEKNHLIFNTLLSFRSSVSTPASYFLKLQGGKTFNDVERQVYEQIGDVDENYAYAEFAKILLRFENEQSCINLPPSIFLESLELFGWVDRSSGKSMRKIPFFTSFEMPSKLGARNLATWLAASRAYAKFEKTTQRNTILVLEI